jgi:hypothetical protein
MLAFAVFAMLAVSVSAQSASYNWMGGTIALYNYQTLDNGSYVCSTNNSNTTVTGTASGTALAGPTTLGCVTSATAGATYTVSCDKTVLADAGALSFTSFDLSGTEYATNAGCSASPRTGATGRTFTAGSNTLLPSGNTLGKCQRGWDSNAGWRWTFIGTCPNSGANAIIPSIMVVAVAFAAAFLTTKA